MIVTDGEQFELALRQISEAKEITVDTETTGLDYVKDQVCGIATLIDDCSYYFPFRHGEGANLPMGWLPSLIKALSQPAKWYCHNGKFDLKMLYKDGLPTPDALIDTQLAAHLVNENEDSFGLKQLGDKYLGADSSAEQKAMHAAMEERGIRGKANQGASIWRLPAELVGPYAEQDVRLTRKLWDHLLPQLQEDKIEHLAYEVATYSLAIMRAEIRGLQLDVNEIHRQVEQTTLGADEMRSIIAQLAGYPLNPNSPKQLQQWLGVDTTARDHLELMEHIPGVSELLQYRQLSKARNTYLDPFLERMDANHVLHPDLNLRGTVSGRPSCSRPNLLAIPRVRGKYRIKDVFVARPGYELLEADLSAAEMRVACHFGRVDDMARSIEAGLDIHQQVADAIGSDRHVGKTLNFMVLYGAGYRKLAEKLRIPEAQAKKYLTNYHRSYPGFKRLMNAASQAAGTKGYICMFTGRKRHFNCPIAAPLKDAANNLIQGSVNEMIRIAFTRIDKETPFRPLLTVYDSIVMEIPEGTREESARQVRAIMEHQPWCTVKIKADTKAGHRLGSLDHV